MSALQEAASRHRLWQQRADALGQPLLVLVTLATVGAELEWELIPEEPQLGPGDLFAEYLVVGRVVPWRPTPTD